MISSFLSTYQTKKKNHLKKYKQIYLANEEWRRLIGFFQLSKDSVCPHAA